MASRSPSASQPGKPAKSSKTSATRDAGTKTVPEKAAADRPKKATSRLAQTARRPALRDVPDIRDRLYEPTLRPLPSEMLPPKNLTILDQGQEGACTGFALAAAIHRLLKVNPDTTDGRRRVSPQMLYTMARRHDEWPGEDYEGSSLRGALRGFYNCGVCSETLWGIKQQDVTLASARDARTTTLGAYYRLRPNLSDYHAAINETGVIYVSASVHEGWENPAGGKIKPGGEETGGHAFVIVGYTDAGFWIQNSWGKDWGKGGLALWEYCDWARCITDAWVLQLAVSAPSAFGLGFSRGGGKTAVDVSRARRGKPHRQEIAGHFVHLNNGEYSKDAPYWSSAADVHATATAIAGGKSEHFLFYAHGGLNSPEDAATRTAATFDGFARNSIYPYSVFYDTGLARTLKDIIVAEAKKIAGLTGGIGDFWDGLVEKAVGPVGKSLWREMKRDACLPFEAGRDGEAALKAFLAAFAARKGGLPIHMAGHSTGGVQIGHLLDALERIAIKPITIESISLMAPACTIDFYKQHYRPYLTGTSTKGRPTRVRVQRLHVYNLDDEAEKDDNTGQVYRKSLLYLVSNAFEEDRKAPLLGMQKFTGGIANDKGLTLFNTRDHKAISKACGHGDFDNDASTMNNVLKTILGKAPAKPFTKDELDYGGA
jgi:hypothetical protein